MKFPGYNKMVSAAPVGPSIEQAPGRASDTIVLETISGPQHTAPAPGVNQPLGLASIPVMLGILAVGLFINTFRTMDAIDLKSDESTYAIESVSMARTGMTRWNGGPFLVHPPLFFAIEGLYFKALGAGEGTLFTRLIDGPYTAGEALIPADTQLTGTSMPDAIELARYLNAFYGAILAVLVFLLGSVLLSPRLGLLASALFMLDPYVVWRNHFNYLEGLTIVFGLLAVLLYYVAERRTDRGKRLRGMVAAGLALGLALLTKELALLFVLAIVAYWLLFRRSRPGETALPLGIGLALYMLFPAWAAINGEFLNWWDTRSWLLKRLTGQISDSGVNTDRPGASIFDTIGTNLPDYWPWFLVLGVALLLAIGFVYLYFRRGLRDNAGELLAGSVIGTYGFFVIVKLVGGVINEHFFYYLMPFAATMPAYVALAWPRMSAAISAGRAHGNGRHSLRAGVAPTGSGHAGPDAPTMQVHTLGGRSRAAKIFLGALLVLLAYNAVAWVARYGFSVDNSYIAVDAELGKTLPPGTGVVGRDLLDLYLMPKQAVYTFTYLNFIGKDIDPANILDRRIPYALLNDQSLQERYGGATPVYYDWVRRNGTQVSKFDGRLYNTYAYHLDYSKPEQAFNADSLSAGRPVVASSVEDPRYFAPENAVDTRLTTRWSSQVSDNEWIYIDLGQSKSIGKVVLSWEDAFARSYELQVSDDARTWRTFYSTNRGAGGFETVNAAATGRYVRLLMTERGTQYGYSLWEISVYP